MENQYCSIPEVGVLCKTGEKEWRTSMNLKGRGAVCNRRKEIEYCSNLRGGDHPQITLVKKNSRHD